MHSVTVFQRPRRREPCCRFDFIHTKYPSNRNEVGPSRGRCPGVVSCPKVYICTVVTTPFIHAQLIIVPAITATSRPTMIIWLVTLVLDKKRAIKEAEARRAASRQQRTCTPPLTPPARPTPRVRLDNITGLWTPPPFQSSTSGQIPHHADDQGREWRRLPSI